MGRTFSPLSATWKGFVVSFLKRKKEARRKQFNANACQRDRRLRQPLVGDSSHLCDYLRLGRV